MPAPGALNRHLCTVASSENSGSEEMAHQVQLNTANEKFPYLTVKISVKESQSSSIFHLTILKQQCFISSSSFSSSQNHSNLQLVPNHMSCLLVRSPSADT